MAADSAGGWLLLSGILNALPILGVVVLLLAVSASGQNSGPSQRVNREMVVGGLVGAIIFCVIGLVFVLPIFLGAWSMSRSASYGLSIVGAVFSLLLGIFYCLPLLQAVAALGRGQLCPAVVYAIPGLIGIISVCAGIKTFITLSDPDVKERFGIEVNREPVEDDRRDSRRRRRDEEEEDDRRAARRHRADEDEDGRRASRKRPARRRDRDEEDERYAE